MRDLLSHRTGIASHNELWPKSPFSRKEIFERLRYLSASGEFRDDYEYSNLMFMAAGYIVGRLNECSWEQFVQKRILSPIGMTRTKFSIRESESDENFAHPYYYNGKEFERCWYHVMDEIAPAGGITTSAEDMCQWLKLHLADGVFNGDTLVSKRQIRQTHRPRVVNWSLGNYKEVPFGAYCLGWAYNIYRGNVVIMHGGGTRGYQAVVTLLPRENLGIVTMSNYFGQPIEDIITYKIIDRILELEEIDWYTRYDGGAEPSTQSRLKSKKNKESKTEWRIPKGDMDKLVGSYEHPGYGPTTVGLKEDKLFFTYNTNECEMEYVSFNNFILKTGWFRKAKISFILDLKGNVESLSFLHEGRGIDNVVFKRLGD